MSDIKVSYRGVGIATLLTVLFVGLKLTNYIDWSWFWVISPMIFQIVIWLLLLLFILILKLIVT